MELPRQAPLPHPNLSHPWTRISNAGLYGAKKTEPAFEQTSTWLK